MQEQEQKKTKKPGSKTGEQELDVKDLAAQAPVVQPVIDSLTQLLQKIKPQQSNCGCF